MLWPNFVTSVSNSIKPLDMSKYIKSFEFHALDTNHAHCQRLFHNRWAKGMAVIYYFVTDKVAKGCSKEHKQEIFKEFEGIKDGFYWSDEFRKTNMITDEKLVKELRKLLEAKKFNKSSFGGELHILFT